MMKYHWRRLLALISIISVISTLLVSLSGHERELPPQGTLVHTDQHTGLVGTFPLEDWDLWVHPKLVDSGVSASIEKNSKCCRATSLFLRASVDALKHEYPVDREDQAGDQQPKRQQLVALDIGANIGYHTIELGVLGCRVVAWELLPMNFRVLKRNVKINGLKDFIDLVPRGASDRRGATMARMAEHSPGMTTLGDGRLPWKMGEVRGGVRGGRGARSIWGGSEKREKLLRVSRGSDELERLGVTRVDLIKIDVEGHEIEALRGLGPSLRALGVRRLHTEFFPGGCSMGTSC
jgi:FkbM family methyltransferase